MKITILVVALLSVIFLSACTNIGGDQDLNETGSDIFDKWYRDEMLDSQLGQLPQFVEIYQKPDGSLFAWSMEGEEIVLDFNIKPLTDFYRVVVDKYQDRVVIQRGDNLYLQKLGEDEEKLIFTMPEEWHSPQLYDVYGDNILIFIDYLYFGNEEFDLQTSSPLFAGIKSNEFRTISISKSQETNNAVLNSSSHYFNGYDINIGGNWYRLLLDSMAPDPVQFPVMKEGGLLQRTMAGTNGDLRIYFKKFTEEPLREFDLMDSVGEEVIQNIIDDMTYGAIDQRRGSFVSFNDPEKADLTLQTQTPKNIKSYYTPVFRLRRLFKLKDSNLAHEIDNGLLVIDAENKELRYTQDAQEINELLENAIIIGIHNGLEYDPFRDDCDPISIGYPMIGGKQVHPDPPEESTFVFCME